MSTYAPRQFSGEGPFNDRLFQELGLKPDMIKANNNGDVYNFHLLGQIAKENAAGMKNNYTPKENKEALRDFRESSDQIVSLPRYENGKVDIIAAMRILQQEITPSTRKNIYTRVEALMERLYFKEIAKEKFTVNEMEDAGKAVSQVDSIHVPKDPFEAFRRFKELEGIADSRNNHLSELKMGYAYKMNQTFTPEELKVLEFCDRVGIRF